MNKKESRLFKYLCMALPYDLKILHEGWNYEWDDTLSTIERIVGIDEKFIYTKVIDTHNGEEYREDKWSIDTFDDKPYLRPMSSMTEEEKKEISTLLNYEFYVDDDYALIAEDDRHRVRLDLIQIYTKWLLKNHFDFMGLIPNGLAIEVTNENNPYEK